MAIVVDKYIGHTHVIIHDDYCKDVTPEQVQKILDRIAANALAAFQAAATNKQATQGGAETE